MKRDSFWTWFVALVSLELVDFALKTMTVGSGRWGWPLAFYRWSSAPPPFATREFFPGMLLADVVVVVAVAWLLARLLQRA